jgi:hypothetical protein
MPSKVKRTYNLNAATVARVRELAGSYGAAPSQDGVVELAIERLYRDIREREEAELWAASSGDIEFRAEMAGIANAYDEPGSWPR